MTSNSQGKITEIERIRIHSRTKREQIHSEAIDIPVDAVHWQGRGGATVSFDHDLALQIEKLIMATCDCRKSSHWRGPEFTSLHSKRVHLFGNFEETSLALL